VSAFKRGFESQENVLRKQCNDSSSVLRPSYCVAHLLAEESKPFSNVEFIREGLQHAVKESDFNTITLSLATFT
jgi:hypothetical protein